MNWILLILAGCLELVFTFCLGKINRVFGMEKYVWSFVLLVSLCVSMLLLIKVTKTLPVGTAYAIWTGIGAAGTVLIGIFFFSKSLNPTEEQLAAHREKEAKTKEKQES